METLLPIRRRASKHPRRANRSPRGTRPSCKLTARPCAARQKAATTPLTNHKKTPQPSFNRNQQYSITALTDGGDSIVERYAYTAYGQVTILDTSLSPLATSAVGNRYTYTGREWDERLSLYHFRARLYDAVGGRFVSRDPIGYVDGLSLYNSYFQASRTDPSGTTASGTLFNNCFEKCKQGSGGAPYSASQLAACTGICLALQKCKFTKQTCATWVGKYIRSAGFVTPSSGPEATAVLICETIFPG